MKSNHLSLQALLYFDTLLEGYTKDPSILSLFMVESIYNTPLDLNYSHFSFTR
jgi:methylglyoxal synthase